MTIPQDTIFEIEPHTKAKHEILQRYLEAWFPILSSYHSRIVYIDGFAGPGRYKGGESGSPIIALNVAKNHRKALGGELVFWFIDEREDRIEHLKAELSGMQIPDHFRVQPEAGRFHEKVGPVLQSIEADGAHIAPTFAFIDPFGFSGIPFSLIKQILGHKRCEALITFQVDAVNRFLEHPNDNIVQHIVDAFGTDESISIAVSSGDRISELRQLYQSQLCSLAKFVRYFEMRDRKDRPIYYLFFATNNRLGHIRMKEAMWRVNPEGEFRFSDATDQNQTVLFDADTASILISQLKVQFKGQGVVSGHLVREFVEDKTAFLNKHKTAALSRLEKEDKIILEPEKSNGTKRRANTYPDDVMMRFQ